jgi:hypothetical protein
MWILYVVWAFSAPDESRIGAYPSESQCQADRAVVAKDDRIVKSKCEYRPDGAFRT